MKKVFLLITIMLFVASLAFAQSIDLDIDGYPSEGSYSVTGVTNGAIASGGWTTSYETINVALPGADDYTVVISDSYGDGGEDYSVNVGTFGGIGDLTGSNSGSSYTGYFTLATVTCPEPTNQIENSITLTSATLLWTAGGSETTWNLEIGPAPLTQGTGSMLTGLTSTTKLVIGLDEDTSYDWYIQADCGADSSFWTGPSNFTTLFSGLQIGSGTETGQSLPIEPYYGYSYSQSIYLDSDFGTPGASKQISKIWYNYSWNGGDEDADTWVIYMGTTDSLSIGTTTDWFPAGSLTEVFNGDVDLELVSGTGWLEIVLDAPFNYNPATDGNLIIAVDENEPSYTSSSDEFYCDLDTRANVSIVYYNDSTNPDPASPPTGTLKAYYPNMRFEFQDIPSCPTPFGLAASSITEDGAALSWTEAGTAALWDIEIVLTGSAFSGTPDYYSVANPYSETGLLSNTSYDWKVRADCGARATSDWSSINTFKTECAATAIPISENFDAVTVPALPDCWKFIDDTGNAFTKVITSTSNPHSGLNCLYMYNSYASAGNLMAISPESSDTAAGTWVRFWARSSYGDQSIDVGTMTDPYDAGTFTLMDSVAINGTYAEYSVMLSGADNYVVFKHAWDGSADYNYIDDIVWEEVPACFQPTGLVTTNITNAAADLAWVEMNIPSASLWEVEYDTTGFAQGTGTIVTGISDTTYTLAGLTENTVYDWYVRADCGTRATSSWSGPVNFTTLFDPVANDSCSVAIAIGNVTDQPFDNSGATTSGFNGNPHTINKDMFYVYTAASNGYLHVDLCRDSLGFDTKLAIYDDCVPTTELGYDDDGCPNVTRTTMSQLDDIPVMLGEDYMIQVGAYSTNFGAGDITISLDSCVPADSVVTENILQNTADLVWYNHGAPTTYDVIIDTAGFAFDVNGTPTYAGVSSPYGAGAITPLLADTAYEWYVMPTCGDTLDWVGPIAFSTLADCPFPSVLTTADVGPAQADLGWTENGTAISWQINIDTTGVTLDGVPDFTVATNPYTVGLLLNDQSYQWQVRADCGGGTYSDWVGLASFTTLVACPAPTSPTTTDIAATTAVIDWTDGWAEGNWTVEYDTTGFVQTTGNYLYPSAHPITLTSLIANTTYDWYVRADCDGPLVQGNESEWIGPFTFTTPCAVITPYYAEDFTTFIPDCWDEAGAGDETSGPTSIGSGDWSGPSTAIGSGSARINLYSNVDSEWLLSPQFDLSAGGYEVVIDVAVTNWNNGDPDVMGSDDEVKLIMKVDTTWTVIDTFSVADALPNTPTIFNYALSSTDSNVQFGILATDGTINDSEDYDFHVDNFKVRIPPSCPEPTALVTSNITPTTAVVGWTANGTETNWNVEYGPVGFVQGLGTMIPNTTNPDTLTGLSAATMYDWYVQADCDGGTRDESAWIGPVTFTSGGTGTCDQYVMLYDSYGDGWNGGSLDIYRNSYLAYSGLTIATGFGPDSTYVTSNQGDSLYFDYTVGSYGYENEYYVYRISDDAELIAQGAGGVQPIDTWIDYACPPATLAITPSSYDFGNVPIGGTVSQVFSLSNIGMGTVTVINAAAITLTGDAAFSIASITASSGYPVNLPTDTLLVEVQLVSAAAVSYSTSLDVAWGTARDVTSAVITAEGCPAVANDDCANAIAINAPYPTPLGSGSNECTLIDCPGVLDWFNVWYEIELPYAVQDIYITQCGDGVDMGTVGVVLMDDCACDDYILYTSAAWGDSCGTGFQGAEVFYNDVTGPRTLLWPAHAADALDNNVAFNYSVDIESVDFTPTVPIGVGVAADSGTDTVTVSWDYVAGLKYTVYSDTDPYGSFTTEVGTDITVGFLDITPIPAANTFYRVTADVVLVRGVNPAQTYTDPTLNRLTEKGPQVIIGTTKIGTSEKAQSSSRTRK